MPVSSVSNFRPDTGGRRWSLVQVASSVLLRGGRGAADRYRCMWGALTVFRPHWVCPCSRVCVLSPLHCSGSRLLYMEPALHCTRFQFSGSPQKGGLCCACVLCLPQPSSSGSQELDGRTLPGCRAPSPLCGPSLSFRPTSQVRAPCV